MTDAFDESLNRTNQGRMEIRITWLCALALVLEGYDIGALGYTIPALCHAWHVRPVVFTPALTAGSAGLFGGSLLCGWLGDKFGRKNVLIGCVAIFGVMSLLTALATDLTWLTIVRLGTGMGLGGGIPTSITLLSDFSTPRKQGGLVIAMTCGVTVGNVLGGVAAARLIEPYGWRSVFIVGGLAPLLLLPLIIFLLPESFEFLAARRRAAAGLPAQGSTENPVGALFTDAFARTTAMLWIINFLSLLTIYFMNAWLPSILHSASISARTAIIVATMFHVGGIAGAFISGFSVVRFGVEKVFSALLIVAAGCLFALGFSGLSVFAIGSLVLVSGIGISASQLGINSLPGSIYPPAIRSTGTGWAIGVGRLGNIAGPLLGGLFLSLNWTPDHMLRALCVPIFVLVGMFMLLLRARSSERENLRTAVPVLK